MKTGDFENKTVTSNAAFILSNYLYLGVVLSCSVSRPFRKPFYTNPYYTANLLLLWLYNTLLVVVPWLSSDEMMFKNPNNQQSQILILAMVYGNMVMILMYMYENLLASIFDFCRNRKTKNQSKVTSFHEEL